MRIAYLVGKEEAEIARALTLIGALRDRAVESEAFIARGALSTRQIRSLRAPHRRLSLDGVWSRLGGRKRAAQALSETQADCLILDQSRAHFEAAPEGAAVIALMRRPQSFNPSRRVDFIISHAHDHTSALIAGGWPEEAAATLPAFEPPTEGGRAAEPLGLEKPAGAALVVAAIDQAAEETGTLAKAFSYLPDTYHLWFAGAWPRAGDIGDLAASAGVDSSRLRSINGPFSPALAELADATVVSGGIREGAPTGAAAFASWRNGTPTLVLAHEKSGTSNGLEIFAHEKNSLIVRADDAAGVADAIIRITKNQELRDAIINAASRQTPDDQDGASLLDAYLDIFQRAVAQKSGSTAAPRAGGDRRAEPGAAAENTAPGQKVA